MAYLGVLPNAANYEMDGGQLIDARPVSQLTAIVDTNVALNTKSIVLNWTNPGSGAITILRDGQAIASDLPAGTTTYTDTSDQLASAYPTAGTYQPGYTVVAGGAARNVTISFTYTPPVPLSTNLANNLVAYYPAASALPAADAMAHSTLAPWSANADGGSLVPDPFGNNGALQVDMHAVDGATGENGYRLLPGASGAYDAAYDITANSGSFTIGFWYNAPCFPLGVANSTDVTVGTGTGTNSVAGANHTYPIFGNKNYVSGAQAGVEIAANSGADSVGCRLIFNVGDGTNRTDPAGGQGTGLGLAYTPNQWIYVAMSVNATTRAMTGYVYDPLLGKRSATATIGASLNLAKLNGLGNGFGLAEDGTGRMSLTICGSPQGNALPTLPNGVSYTASTCGQFPPMAQAFSDIAMWNTAVSGSDLDTIFLSRKPLSTLMPH
jgi:hypothetical protein